MKNHRTETLRLTPSALSEALEAAGLGLKEFCHLFDVSYETGKRWVLAEDNARALEPPYWITPVLYLLSCDKLAPIRCQRLRQENDAGARQPEASHAD